MCCINRLFLANVIQPHHYHTDGNKERMPAYVQWQVDETNLDGPPLERDTEMREPCECKNHDGESYVDLLVLVFVPIFMHRNFLVN